MQSALFDQANLEVEAERRFALQNPQMVRVRLGDDVIAVKGAMVASQGHVRVDHEKSGGATTMFKKSVTREDVSLMRVSGEGDAFFASQAGYVFLIELSDDALSVNARNLLAFDSVIEWDIRQVEGAGGMSAGLLNTSLRGTGTVAVHTVGQPVILDCAQQPTYVDVEACVGWSGGLVPQVVSSMNVRSMLRGGSGEAFQYAFHGEGLVVVQPSEWAQLPSQGGHGFHLGGLLDG